MPFLKAIRGSGAGRHPAARFEPPVDATAEQVAARKEAAGLPGYRLAEQRFGGAIAAGATAVLIEVAGTRAIVRHRIDNAWQQAEPFEGDEGAKVAAALEKLAGPLVVDADGAAEGGFVVTVAEARRPCRLSVRAVPAGSRVLVVMGGELPAQQPGGLAGLLGKMVPGRRESAAAAAADPTLPAVDFAAESAVRVAGIEGAQRARELLAAAVLARAGGIAMEVQGKQAGVHHDVDGVWRPAATLDAAAGAAVTGAFLAAAAIDQRQGGRRRSGGCEILVDGKPSRCTVRTQAVTGGERILVELEHGRPRFKTPADLGMSAAVAGRVAELVALDRGILVVATPRHGGLASLFNGVLQSIDRLLRDVVALEDAAFPRAAIQNVRQVRWDRAAKLTPVAVLEKAVRDDARVLATCDLEDADLARNLAAQAEQGRLVIVGLRGGDAVDGIANLAGLGVAGDALGRLLVGSIGGRLVRKLCPKCREDYLPSPEELAWVESAARDRAALYRARQGGCGVCGGTGYLGRTGIFEIAAGPTLNRSLAAAADAKELRKAAVRDGMVPLANEARRLLAEGVTSLAEIRRVFRKG